MQSENIRIKPAVNYRLTQYKKKNKLKNKSEAIEHLLANDSLVSTRSHIAEKQSIKAWAVVDADGTLALCMHYLIYPNKESYPADHITHPSIETDRLIPVLITPIKLNK